MLDLQTPKADSPGPETNDAGPGRRGQRVWAVLLVLDSFFVIIFGGALAAKIYQHWQSPPPARLVAARPVARPVSKPAAAPPAVPAPKAAPAPRLAAAPATISVPRKAANGPTLKPSLMQDAPRHLSAAPQGAAASAAPAPDQASVVTGAKAKAQPVEFHYKGGGRKVELAGAFIVHGGGRKAMIQRDGTWSLTIYLTPNTYRYWFVVDGKKVLDPENSEKSRAASVVSVSAKP